MSDITLTRLGYDINGNPRYVCHYTHLLTEAEKQTENEYIPKFRITTHYALAIARAHKIGGRKYHNKSYGGGIVFQSYATEGTNCERMFLKELEKDIKALIAKAEAEEK